MDVENFKEIIKNKNLFPIVPLKDYKNVPYTRWSSKENRINDIEELERTSLNQVTGFSLLTGKISDVMVIDIDKNHGDGSVDGDITFHKLINELSQEDKNIINSTLKVKTPNGGTHLYFKYKEGIKSKANYFDGVDIKTDGGLIVLPYTKRRLKNGEIKEYTLLKNLEIKEMPKVLFNKFLEVSKPTTKKENNITDKSKARESFKGNKYYKVIKEGEGRDNALISWLGYIIKNNPTLRTKENLLPHAIMYNQCWFNPPLDIETVESKVESVLKYALPSYCDEKGNINNWSLVQHILEHQPSYTKGNLWFLYDNKKGFYEYKEFKEVQRMFFDYAINDKDKTVTRSKNFAELLMLNSSDAKDIHDEKEYINCLNGIIDIENNILLKHDAKYKTEIQFKANLISNSEEYEKLFEKSEFKRFLNDILDEDSINTLQESWGLMLSPHAREVQNCFIYKGEGSNGKSVAFDIQESLIGDNKHICSIGLGDFGETFAISVAEGKHVNIVRDDELSGKTVNKAFKSMCCGEPVTVNRKNKDLVRLGFNMTMFFGLNRMPSASDKSTGFFRRPIIIPFNTSFGTEKEVSEGIRDKVKDTQIAERIIKNELDIVFTWAYKGLKLVKKNNWKVTISKAAVQEMEDYRQEADSAYAFFKERIRLVPKKNTKIQKKEVYNSYNSWCAKNNITPMNPTHLGRQFSSFGVKSKVSNSIRYYLNIEFNDFKEVNEESPFK